MKMKKIIALLLVAVMAMSLMVGCGQEKEEPLEFVFIGPMSGGAAWSQAEKGFYAACEELGIDGQYLSPVERNNVIEIANLLEQSVTQEVDAAIGVFLSAEMFGPALTKGRENGMVTASVQMTLSEEYIDFQIGTDQAGLGRKMAEALIELADGKEVTMIWMCGGAGETQNMQYAAFQEAIKGHDNITDLGMRFDEGSAATANQILVDELTANPGLNCVLCLDSSAATIGTASFVDERGLEDEWLTIGIDASADILNYVKAGALDATMNQDFYAMGYKSTHMAYELIVNNKKPDSFKNDSGCYLIRPSEVDQYAKDNNIDLG